MAKNKRTLPEWTVKNIVYPMNLNTVTWDAPILQARINEYNIGVGQSVVFVNARKDRVRAIVRTGEFTAHVACAMIDTRAVIWDSPFHPVIFFTEWLVGRSGNDWSTRRMTRLLDQLWDKADAYKASKTSPPASTKPRDSTRRTPSHSRKTYTKHNNAGQTIVIHLDNNNTVHDG